MPHFSKRDPAPRGSPRSDEFTAPSSRPRPRGSSEGFDEFKEPTRSPVTPVTPAASARTAAPLPGSRSGPARDELKICGLAAVRARFARDPSSIQRLFFDHATGQRVGVMCKVLAQAKRIYRQVEPAELEKVAGSIHHGGIVAVVSPPALRTTSAEEISKWAKRGETLLVLDRIGNAHNLGAIARTAAFFGVPRIVIPDTALAARPTDAAHRVAEGGFEHLEVWLAKDLVSFAREAAAAGYEVVGAATRGGRPDTPRGESPRGESPRGERGRARPIALVLGNEEQGIGAELGAACTRLVTIPGSGKIESLNVSVAAAVLMWELFARK